MPREGVNLQPTHAFIRWGRTAKVPTVAVPVTDERAKAEGWTERELNHKLEDARA